VQQEPVASQTTSHSLRATTWSVVAAVALLATHAALSIDTIRRKSVTVDEVGHLPAGISYWQRGTFELYHHNPPLVKLIAALPALAAHPVVDYSKSWEFNRRSGMPLSQWAFGWEFMYANAARYHDIYFWARLPVVCLSLIAGAVVFLWSRELFGSAASVIAVALWSFCPNTIAHAGLITTDMGAASLGFVATYFFWRYLRQRNWPRAAAAGMLLGLAQLAKFSLLMLYMLWPAMWCVALIVAARGRASVREPAAAPSRRKHMTPPITGQRVTASQAVRNYAGFAVQAKHIAGIVVISIFMINAGYLFEGTGTALGKFQFLSRSLTRPRTGPVPPVAPTHPLLQVIVKRQNRFEGTWLAKLPVPLPKEYVAGFDEQKMESEGFEGQGYPVYLRGELRRTGWWYYYLYALAIKVPLGTWIITMVAAATAVLLRSARANVLAECMLLAPIASTLFTMSFLTDINLGLRYVLLVFPFWFVAISRVACWIAARRFAVAAMVLVGIGWNHVRCVWVHPDHLAYFNEAVGGPRNGYRHLIDSNLDWGQDLLALESWLARNRPGEPVHLAYFGNVDPSILAASGRPISFLLAAPVRHDSLRLVASKPDGELFQERNLWISQHQAELQAWLRSERSTGRSVVANDHPAIRAMAFDRAGLGGELSPGLYAISANLVAGLPFRIRDQAGTMWHAEQDAYGYFRTLSPIEQVGYSIFVYDISEEQARRLVGRQ
jgi:hypothetical protein